MKTNSVLFLIGISLVLECGESQRSGEDVPKKQISPQTELLKSPPPSKSITESVVPTPSALPLLPAPPVGVRVQKLVIGNEDGCALEEGTGKVFCWDNRSGGKEELDLLQPAFTPEQAVYVPGLANIKTLTKSETYVCALTEQAQVRCFELDKVMNDKAESTPDLVEGLSDVVEIAAIPQISYALKADGEVWIWGRKPEMFPNKLQGTIMFFKDTPGGHGKIIQIVASESQACVRSVKGKVMCWGKDNSKAELGTYCYEEDEHGFVVSKPECGLIAGSQTYRWKKDFPTSWKSVYVPSLESPTDLSAGYYFGCAVHQNGHVGCWGSNESYQVGSQSGAQYPGPSAILKVTNTQAIASGKFHTCAAVDTGVVYCWGNNQWGQLGDGTHEKQWIPVEVKGVTDAVSLALSEKRSCAVKKDGSTVCWGNQVAEASK